MKLYLRPMIFTLGLMTTIGANSAHGIDRNFTVTVNGVPPTNSPTAPKLDSFRIAGSKYWCQGNLCNVNGSQNRFTAWEKFQVVVQVDPSHPPRCGIYKDVRTRIDCSGDLSQIRENGRAEATVNVNECQCQVRIIN